MMAFRDREKKRYLQIKKDLFSAKAQSQGTYKKKTYHFCLADGYSKENLHESLRDEAIDYFQKRNIPWHDGFDSDRGKNTLPSGHLCCSQSMCVNTLWHMTKD